VATRTSRNLYVAVAVLVALLVIVSTIAGLYYYQYSQAQAQNSTYVSELNRLNVKYLSDVLIDYGNGTRHWFNVTNVQPGTNFYVETQVITGGQINATYYPQYQSHFVTALNNVGNTNSLYWLLWTYNKTALWQQASAGPDLLPVFNGSIFAWSYCGANCTQP
jgi:hypothetical protein